MQDNYKIAIIARLLYPYAIGGAEIHTYYISRALAKNNQVILISEGSGSPVFQENLERLEIKPFPFRIFQSIVFILQAFILLTIRVKSVNVVHAQVALSPVVVGILAKMCLRKPLIITCHGSEVRLQKNLFVKILQGVAFSVANSITSVSSEIKVTITSNYNVVPSKISVVPNGYDPELINKYSKKYNSACSIVYVGRLSYPKDPFTLLRAFVEIYKNFPNVHLCFVGDGKMSSTLKLFSNKHNLLSNVQFFGKLPHNEALKITALSTVFVLSSYEEGLPTSLIEAMALGKPIIATKVGGIPEIVTNGVNGLLVPLHSPILMADACMKLLTDEVLRKTLGVKASETLKGCTWDKIAEKYETLYNNVLN